MIPRSMRVEENCKEASNGSLRSVKGASNTQQGKSKGRHIKGPNKKTRKTAQRSEYWKLGTIVIRLRRSDAVRKTVGNPAVEKRLSEA